MNLGMCSVFALLSNMGSVIIGVFIGVYKIHNSPVSKHHSPRPMLRLNQLHSTTLDLSQLQLSILIIHNRKNLKTLAGSEFLLEFSILR